MKYYVLSLLLSILWINCNAQSADKNYQNLTQIERFEAFKNDSNLYYNQGDYVNSIKNSINALKTALVINDPHYIYQGYRMLAYNYLDLNDTLTAKENFSKAEYYAKLSEDENAVGLTIMDLANVISTVDADYSKALEYHDKSIEIFERTKDTNNLLIANYNAILTAFENKDYINGYSYLLKSRRFLEKFSKPNLEISLDNLMGQYYFLKQNYNLSESYLLKSIAEAEKDSLYLELEDSYNYLHQVYQSTNRIEDANIAKQKHLIYSSINEDIKKHAEANALAMDFQVDEFRRDIEAAELENELQLEKVRNKSTLNYILIAISIAAFIVSIFLFRAYKSRRALIRQLKKKNKEYLKAKQESERLAKAKSKFFSTVSHELRTPLYGVIGLSTILLEDKDLKNHKEDLKSLKFSADYLLALINDVLQINKLDANNASKDHSAFNIREILTRIVASFEFMRIQNNNKIHIDVDSKIPNRIKGNTIHLSQVLMNLIGNACKFTENGDIHVTASLNTIENDTAVIDIAIKDNGIGIPIEKQKTIFDEFEQGDSLNYSYQGTGLGLPIVKKLLILEGADINLESEHHKGSTFSFTLPFKIMEDIEVIMEEITPNTTSLEGKRILIVEDNRINQIVTKKILEKDKVLCDTAENGQIAVEKTKEKEYDLILMDINMPVLDGIKATKKIRKFNNDIPILALTAVEIEEMRQSIYDSGMNDIIVKPYDASKFRQTILRNISNNNTDNKTDTPSILKLA